MQRPSYRLSDVAGKVLSDAPDSGVGGQLGRAARESALVDAVLRLRSALDAEAVDWQASTLSLEVGPLVCLRLDARLRVEADTLGFRVLAGAEEESELEMLLPDIGHLRTFLAGFVAGRFGNQAGRPGLTLLEAASPKTGSGEAGGGAA